MIPGIYFSVPFEMGNVVVHADANGVVKAIRFDLDGLYDERRTVSKLRTDMIRYFEGIEVVWDVDLDLKGLPDFTRRVYEKVARIPYGYLSTYGEIANDVGCIGGARAVGQVMAANRFPLIVPCHRIISSGGAIGGFSSGIDLKRHLLGLEGIDI